MRQGTQQEWQVVFLIAAALFFCGATTFLVLAQGEVQPWATINDELAEIETEQSTELIEKITSI